MSASYKTFLSVKPELKTSFISNKCYLISVRMLRVHSEDMVFIVH